MRSAAGTAARTLALCVVLGAAVGVLWWLLVPTPELVRSADGWFYRATLPGEFVTMDGWFAVLTAGAGLVVAVVVVRRRDVSVLSVVVVTVAGLIGSATAWAVGRFLGPERPDLTAEVSAGTVAHAPLTLTAHGVLVVWPMVTLVVVLFALAWRREDPDGLDRVLGAREPSSSDSDSATNDQGAADASVGRGRGAG